MQSFRNHPFVCCAMSAIFGAFVMLVAVWFGPVAERNRVIKAYEAQVMELARQVDKPVVRSDQ